MSLFLGNTKYLKEKKVYKTYLETTKTKQPATLMCCSEEPEAYCIDTKWKVFVILNMDKKSKELGIQNNTDKLSLQHNQWCLGEKNLSLILLLRFM